MSNMDSKCGLNFATKSRTFSVTETIKWQHDILIEFSFSSLFY